jgi:hypothetical protein
MPGLSLCGPCSHRQRSAREAASPDSKTAVSAPNSPSVLPEPASQPQVATEAVPVPQAGPVIKRIRLEFANPEIRKSANMRLSAKPKPEASHAR